MAGEIDFRKMGKSTLFQDLKIASDDKAITWDEWDVEKLQDTHQIRMKKRISEDVNIDFKKFIAGERIDESIRGTDEIQLEYKLHPNNSLKMVVWQDRDFLGFEHKDKF